MILLLFLAKQTVQNFGSLKTHCNGYTSTALENSHLHGGRYSFLNIRRTVW